MIRIFTIAALAAALALPAVCQTPLQVVVTGSGAVGNVPVGGTVTLTASDIGQPATAAVTVVNTSASAVSITGVSNTGTSEITVVAPAFPISLNPNASAVFTVQYLPASGNVVSAQLGIAYSAGSVTGSFPLFVSGVSPHLTYSYSLAGGALTDLASGDHITFPGTNTGSSVSAVVNVLNRGSASAVVQSVSVTGAGFSGSRGGFLLAAGTQTSFTVVFAPQSAGGNQGLLSVALANSSVSFALSGTGTSVGFSISYALADGNAHLLSDGAAVAFPSIDINATSTAAIEIQNQGTGAGAVSGIQVTGSAFRLSGSPALPANVGAGQSLRFGIVFAPTQAGAYSGTFRIDLPGRSVSGTLSGSTASSSFSLAYIDPNTNNVLPLPDGATMPFPGTSAGAASSVTLVATNNGAGTGTIDSIAVNTATASTFQLLNLPVFPAAVAPGQQLRFALRFTPQQPQAYSGSLLVSINGRVTTIGLDARGAGPRYTYTYGSGATAAAPGGTVPLADTTVGQTTSMTISIANGGTADGQIAAIGVTGSGFSVTDLPALPVTIKVGASQSFTLNFAPAQPGAVAGRLTVGADTFTVSANAIGSRLTFSYTNTASAVPVADGGLVIFPPIDVGKNEKLQFSIQNTGTSAAAISSINLAAPSASFSLDQLPALPFNLDAGATASFAVGFTPGTTGGLTATLRVNATTFTLSGNGQQPAALPSYQFQAPPSSTKPAQQPAIGLTLATPYPVALNGTLVLSFVSSVFTDDPAIQFASGGRTVNFTIPANTTQALFNGNPTIALQTGTTAGSIVIKPSFAMASGFDMTPASPDALSIAIPPSVPQLLSASISSPTTTSFTVVLSGFSTTRALTQLDVQITPKAGENFSTAHLTIDVNAASSSWYQSTAAQTAGGSFLAAIPFVLSNGSSTEDLVHRLQSLSITATNQSGASSSVTVPIQ